MKYIWLIMKALYVGLCLRSDYRYAHVMGGVLIGIWLLDDFAPWVARQIHRMATR